MELQGLSDLFMQKVELLHLFSSDSSVGLAPQTPLDVYLNNLAREANSYIFGTSDTFPNSASTSLWTKLVDLTSYLKYLRIGEVMASVLLFGMGLVMTDWRNEGYAWYIHNSIMGVTVLATVGLLLSSLFPTVTLIIPDFATSFFTFALSA